MRGLGRRRECWIVNCPWELRSEDSVGLAATSADLRLRHFHWRLPIAQGGKLQQLCLMMANGSHEPPGEGSWDAVLCHPAPRDLWFCFLYLSVSILTVIWSAERLGPTPSSPEDGTPCFLLACLILLISIFYHSLFLLFLVSQLTALGTKRTRSLTACGFLATPQRNMSVCFFKNKLNILMFYFSISGEPLGQIRRCWQTVIKGGSFCSFPRVTVAGPLVFLHMLIWEFINQRHATHIRCLFKELKW